MTPLKAHPVSFTMSLYYLVLGANQRISISMRPAAYLMQPTDRSLLFPQGESGTLDYIFASATAAFQRIGKLVHHEVNAVEPVGLE